MGMSLLRGASPLECNCTILIKVASRLQHTHLGECSLPECFPHKFHFTSILARIFSCFFSDINVIQPACIPVHPRTLNSKRHLIEFCVCWGGYVCGNDPKFTLIRSEAHEIKVMCALSRFCLKRDTTASDSKKNLGSVSNLRIFFSFKP